MHRLTPRMLDAIAIAVALVILAAGAWFVWSERIHARAERASQLAAAERLRDDLAKAEDRLSRQLGVLGEAETLVQADKALVRSLAIRNEVLGQITQLAGDSGLAVDALSPRTPRSKPPIHVVDMGLTGRGTFPDLLRFLRRAKQIMPDIRVEAILVSGEAGRATPDLAFKIDLAWHAVSADSAAAAPPKTGP